MATGTRPIAEIIIGDRLRRDMGDIKALAESISDIGLLHPIVIRHDGLLLAGRRRLEACRRLGWEAIPVSVVTMGHERR
jgi:ParB family chromosome partitioning protein